jgi:DNA invertase Pin-like site-specific DNA recombinase
MNAKRSDDGRVLGYARVSTNGQDLTSQEGELRKAGCTKVYAEKLSGVRADRPELRRLIERDLQRGDTVVITRLDRLARSSRDLLNVIHEIEERGGKFRSLADAWCDTGSAHGRLMLQILGSVAEFEHALIKARTSEGRKRAREEGIRFGRKPKLTPHQRAEALVRINRGKESLSAIAHSYNVDATTIGRLRDRASHENENRI